MTEWINIKDRIPSDNEKVLIIQKDFNIYVAALSAYSRNENDFSLFLIECNCRDGSCANDVTHWMSLPKPPEQQEEIPMLAVFE